MREEFAERFRATVAIMIGIGAIAGIVCCTAVALNGQQIPAFISGFTGSCGGSLITLLAVPSLPRKE